MVHPEEFLIVNSRSIHSCRTDEPEKGYYGYAVQIRYDFLKSCYPGVEHGEFEILYNGDHQKQIHSCLSEMIELYKSEELLTDLALLGKLYELVRLLCAYTLHTKQVSSVSVSGKHRDRLSEVINYLDDNYDTILDARNVAEHFHKNQKKQRLFRVDLTIPDSLCISQEYPWTHYQYCMQNIHPTRRYSLSRNVF